MMMIHVVSKKLQFAMLAASLAGAMGAMAQVPAFVNPPQTAWSPPWAGLPPYQRDIYWNLNVDPVGDPSANGTPGAAYGGTLDSTLKASDSVSFLNNVQYFSSEDSPDGFAGFGINNTGGQTTLSGTAVFLLDNTTTEGQKNIYIELEGLAGNAASTASISIYPQGDYPPVYVIHGGQVGNSQYDEFSGLFTQDFGYTVVPNPTSEYIDFNFSVAAGSYDIINSLQIATQCVPDTSSTLALFGLGTLGLLAYDWRRRMARA